MGITGLVSWVKKFHPEVIVHFPNRWASANFTGKKVAIDATLMTNRYHFASRDGPFKGKGEIIGWYNLITEMRAFGVQPIAIWDERGTREWKAPEALKRLTTRANHLARKNHENERLIRLESLREVFKEFQIMSKEEKDIIRAHWETTRFMFMRPEESENENELKLQEHHLKNKIEFSNPLPTPPPTPKRSDHDVPLETVRSGLDKSTNIETAGLPLTPPPTPPLPSGIAEPSKAAQLNSTLSEADSEVIDRVVGMIDSLAPLIQEYRDSQRGTTKKEDEIHLTLGMEGGIVEMEEEIREWIPNKKTTSNAEGQDRSKEEKDKDREEKLEELDYALEELLPLNQISETPRQMALSREEGKIISDILSTPPLPPFKSAYPTLTSKPQSEIATATSEEPSEVYEEDPIERLDNLIKFELPMVKSIYERALDIPSAADHEDCKEFLKVMGVPVLEAKIPYEAEGLASALAKNGLVDYVATEDSDVLAYEGPLLKNISPITSTLSLISGSKLREKLNLTPSEYLDFLILLGTDASPRIPTIGPINALKLIKLYKSIENILNNQPNLIKKLKNSYPSISKENFLKLIYNARKVFKELPLIENFKLELELGLKQEQKEWNEELIENYLKDKHGISFIPKKYEL
uniref:Exonuclease 1 n=1 Tax=Kwoniella pini CBS 10737 TaxID=1296096 RepID=A0A1B9I5I6_9TREE|nr:uncharacterized protein I206_02851 [Kwoniella pini CBS 10737]OCF50794.1 hypothetical protein I206_02851 [Kwoniella pini CBS 10737]